MTSPMGVIDETTFEVEYRPLPNPSDGGNVWTYEDVQPIPTTRLWTLVEGEGGSIWAVPGYHLVNRVGYVVTEKPWQDPDVDAVWILPETLVVLCGTREALPEAWGTFSNDVEAADFLIEHRFACGKTDQAWLDDQDEADENHDIVTVRDPSMTGVDYVGREPNYSPLDQ